MCVFEGELRTLLDTADPVAQKTRCTFMQSFAIAPLLEVYLLLSCTNAQGVCLDLRFECSTPSAHEDGGVPLAFSCDKSTRGVQPPPPQAAYTAGFAYKNVSTSPAGPRGAGKRNKSKLRR